jgi:hypothetical protein
VRHQTYGKLAVLAFALILVSFVVLGTTRGFVGFRTASLLAAPTSLLAALLAVFLFVRGVLAWTGVAELD